MGSGISSNYENITPLFNVSYWKVHSATRKDSHDPVSLWLLDMDKIRSDSSNKKERNTYMESCLYSIKTLQQLDHPNVLKVYEANENLSDLAFSSEPISFPLEKDLKYSNDEAYYIADQLASLASYLTNDKKFVSFHYSPGSFVFNSKFILKLCLFNYTSLIVGSQNKTVPRYPWHNIPYAPPLNYTAPEYSNNLQTTSAADTFSYGALITSVFIGKQFFNFQNEKEIQRAIATGSFEIPESIPSDIRGLLQCCFESDPSRRLTFNEIVRFPVFMSLLIRCLRELDSIMHRNQSDRYEFYIRLKQNITLFSLRLLQNKILPLLIADIKLDVRFGSAVFPIIYFISDKMNKEDFMQLVFKPLGDLVRRMDPPEFGVAVLDGVRVIIDHVERNVIYDIVYPILVAGFSSPNSSVQVAAAKNMPYLVSMVTENCMAYNIIPKIGEVIIHASDPKVIGYLLKTYEVGLDKMDNDMFVEGVIPTLFKLWKKIRSPHLARPYLSIIQKQNSSLIKNISFIIPLICEVLKNEEVELQLQGEFCNFVETQIEELKKERGIPINQTQSNLNPNLPLFAKQIQQQNHKPESLPDFPINENEITLNSQSSSSSLARAATSPNDNEFVHLDQNDIFSSFNSSFSSDTNVSPKRSDMNNNNSSNNNQSNPNSTQNNHINQGNINNDGHTNLDSKNFNVNKFINNNYPTNANNNTDNLNIFSDNSNSSGNKLTSNNITNNQSFSNFNSSNNSSNILYSDNNKNNANQYQENVLVSPQSQNINANNSNPEAVQQSINEFSFF